jgi:hypothetical protein
MFILLRRDPEAARNVKSVLCVRIGQAPDAAEASTNPAAARANPRWVRSTECTGCMLCQRAFGMMNPKHHCRRCGWAVCGSCSPNKLVLDQWLEEEKPHVVQKMTSSEPLRVCTNCHGAAMASPEPEPAQ